jgi:hypothetical protein
MICNTPNIGEQRGVENNEGFSRCECPRCGIFVLTDTAQSALEVLLAEAPLRRSLMSYTLRRMQTPDRAVRHRLIRARDLPTFWRQERLPTPMEQADNLILLIGDNQQSPALWLDLTLGALAATIGIAVSSDGDSAGWGWLHSQLQSKEFYRLAGNPPGGVVRVILQMAGWEKYEDLKRKRIESRTAFMALKFDQPILDRLIDECVRPAVKRTGFELRILTEPQGAGLIDNQLRAALLAARFVISDLTHDSFGAYWEAGFGEGRGIPVIYTCEKEKWTQSKSHFDTNHLATIPWDIDELGKAQDSLVAMIRATLRSEARQNDS